MIQAINTVFGTLTTFLEWVFSRLYSLFPDEQNIEHTASFLPASELLNKYNKGFSINGRALDLQTSFKNVLITGMTGSGKSTCVLIPSCLNLRKHSSLCINDPSGELAAAVSGILHKDGMDVTIINYEKPEFGGYNPLHRVRTRSEMRRLAETIIYTSLGNGGKDKFWNMSAAGLLSVLIEIVCTFEERYRHMYQVVQLLHVFSFDPAKIDKLVVKCNSPLLLLEYKSIISNDSKVLKSIVVTVTAATQIFSDPSVALTTSYDTVQFENMRKKRTAIFFSNSVSRMRYYAPVTSLFFQQLMDEILSTMPQKNDLPIMGLIDEASSLYISDLNIVCSNVRKTNCGLLLMFQSTHQIASLYGNDNAKAIRENCFTNVLLPGQPIDVCKEVSSLLGSFDFTDEKGSHSRSLLSPDEVHRLEDSLVMCGNYSAIRLPMKPYYEDYALTALTNISPFIPENNLPFTEPPTISL